MAKLKIRPFLKTNLLKCLNPVAKKGRYYTLTNEAQMYMKIKQPCQCKNVDWNLLGWILSSPKQRTPVLKSMDGAKRTSENIRERASKFNSHLSRISTKGILRELLRKNLVKTELKKRKRHYWLSDEGKETVAVLHIFHHGE